MSLGLTIFLFVDALLLGAVLGVLCGRFIVNGKKAMKEAEQALEEVATEEVAPAVETVEEVQEEPIIVEQPIEEKVEAVEEKPEVKVEEEVIIIPRIKVQLVEGEDKVDAPVAATSDVEEEGDLVIGDIAPVREPVKRIPFAEKMLGATPDVQEFYNSINNKFLLYRKLHARVSSKGVSYRFGRELVAKITYHGKTMKFHLALDIDKYDQKIYHQKDLSEKRAYAEVPFTVKVKSERGLKYALNLIDELAIKNEFLEKRNPEPVDSIAQLKDIVIADIVK